MNTLIIRDDQSLKIAWTPEAKRLREMALDEASLIGSVATPAQQDAAVAAQIALRALINDVEKARVACKDPVLNFGRMIDQSARSFCRPLSDELERVSVKVRDYVAAEETRRRAAEALRLADLAEIERRKFEQLAQAKTVEEVDAIHERIHAEVAESSVPVAAPPRAKGQVVREDWEISVVDIWALAKAHPSCVNIEPRLIEIKLLLNAGVRPPGVEAKKVQTSGVRIGRRETLEIV